MEENIFEFEEFPPSDRVSLSRLLEGVTRGGMKVLNIESSWAREGNPIGEEWL